MRAKGKAALWLALVYGLSTLCYLPQLLERRGVSVPHGLSSLGNGFVFVPAAVTFLFLLYDRGLKAHVTENFRAVSRRELLLCAGVALIGLCGTGGYSLATGGGLFREAYPSVFSLIVGCCYLFATACLEEVAWRAFFLQRLAENGKMLPSLLVGGIAWAF